MIIWQIKAILVQFIKLHSKVLGDLARLSGATIGLVVGGLTVPLVGGGVGGGVGEAAAAAPAVAGADSSAAAFQNFHRATAGAQRVFAWCESGST